MSRRARGGQGVKALRSMVPKVGSAEEVARVRELVRTDWDRPAVVAAAIPAALAKLDPPLLEAAERRVRLSLLVLNQVLRDREASSAYS